MDLDIRISTKFHDISKCYYLDAQIYLNDIWIKEITSVDMDVMSLLSIIAENEDLKYLIDHYNK